MYSSWIGAPSLSAMIWVFGCDLNRALCSSFFSWEKMESKSVDRTDPPSQESELIEGSLCKMKASSWIANEARV